MTTWDDRLRGWDGFTYADSREGPDAVLCRICAYPSNRYTCPVCQHGTGLTP